jgi:competence protein ComEA
VTAWPRSAQLATAFLLGVAAALLVVNLIGSLRWGTRPAELERAAYLGYRIDLNRAGRAELLQVRGIGPALADRIENHRRQHGPFQTVEDLRKVSGIGPATLERIRPWVTVRDDTLVSAVDQSSPAPDTPARDAPRKPVGKKPAILSVPIDINRATAAELEQLSGIGPVLAQRIIDKRPYKSVDDLLRVQGIGLKILEKIRPNVTSGPPLTPISTEE